MDADPETRPCQHEGCTSEGFPCFINQIEEDEEPNGWYCSQHAFEQGFCSICGQFWAGVESFDFGPGYCEHCASEIEDDGEEDAYESGEEYGFSPNDYPE